MHKLLWLEDDQFYVQHMKHELIEFNLQHYLPTQTQNFHVELKEDKVQAILLDLNLSENLSSLELLTEIQSLRPDLPIIILSNNELLSTRLNLLEYGVADYLWKTMTTKEISLRIKNAILNAKKVKNLHNELKLGELYLDLNSLRCFVGNLEIDISKTEFLFYKSLLENHPQSTTVEELKKNVWRCENLEIGTINTFIWKMNSKCANWEYRISRAKNNVFLTQQ